MSQYTPQPGSTGALARRLNEREYRTAVQYMRDCGLTDGFCQELSSAKEEYTPDLSTCRGYRMANQLNCLRCGAGMRFIGREKLPARPRPDGCSAT